ncbi:DUF1565 domain-containing protein [bacterium]|nr:DUF1565 domain-containing protein [bacterium]
MAPAPRGNDANSGSPEAPFATISRAMEAALGEPQRPVVIDISAGSYSESISLASGITLHGGWNSDFTHRWTFPADGIIPDADHESTITGNGTRRCVSIIEAEGVGIEGLTIRDGAAPLPDGIGGGMYIESSSPDIRYCRIVDNLIPADVRGSGAGMCIVSGDPSILHCEFSGNQALYQGGNGGGV